MSKVLVNLSVTDRNGVSAIEEKQILGDSQLYDRKAENDFRVVTLRFALPSFEAELLDMAFQSGKVELSIEQARSLIA